MSNLEHNLTKRVEALFQNEIQKRLSETAENIFGNIKPKSKGNVFENLQERLKAMQQTLEKLTDGLLEVGNKALDDFEKEISNVPEPEKSQGIEKLKELITTEIQDIVKQMTIDKFHE